MPVITRQRATNYAIIPNAVAEDSRLTFEARGVLCYLLAKPNDWKVNIVDLQRAGGIGRDKVYRILNELLAAGYIERRQARLAQGTVGEVEYIVYDDPVPDSLPFPENPEAVMPLPEKPYAVQPLPEKPRPVQPDTANTDALIRTQTLPNTQITKNPFQSVPAGFDALWKSWRPDHRPDNRPYAESLFAGLPADVDRRHAIDFAGEYLRMMALRRKRGNLITYLKARAWRELIDAPPLDRDGQYVVTPDREEWQAWLASIRHKHGDVGAETVERQGRIVRSDRWPATVPPQQLRLAVG